MAQKTTLKEFESVWPKLEEALLDHAKSYKLPAAELAWLKKVWLLSLSIMCSIPMQLADLFCFPTFRTSRPTPSAGNATGACLSPTRSPSSWADL